MRRIFSFLGFMTLITVITGITLWLTNHPVAAVIFWAITAGIWIMLIVVSVWAAASWWTTQTMERGAEIALRAQQINDTWDTKKTAALVQLIKEGLKAGQLTRSASNPTLPLPSQEAGWLPPLSSFDNPVLDGTNDATVEDP